MRAAVLTDYSGAAALHIEDRPQPTPGAGDVLIKIAASPINPSDVSFIIGQYGIRKNLPVVPGFEASGEIVAVGEGVDSDRIGQRVACLAGDHDGTWAEYMVTSAMLAYPVPDNVSDEQASMMLVNPLTAWALIAKAREVGTPAIIQTAAGSALAGMIRRLAVRHNIAVIDIVRRTEQVEALKAEGALYVLNSGSEDFFAQLRDHARQLNAMLALDAVGGSLTAHVLRAMPTGSTLTLYGGLAAEPMGLTVDQFIFRDKKLDGFWLSRWLPKAGMQAVEAWLDVSGSIGAEYRSDVRARYKVEDAAAALEDYVAQMSGGKVLITP